MRLLDYLVSTRIGMDENAGQKMEKSLPQQLLDFAVRTRVDESSSEEDAKHFAAQRLAADAEYSPAVEDLAQHFGQLVDLAVNNVGFWTRIVPSKDYFGKWLTQLSGAKLLVLGSLLVQKLRTGGSGKERFSFDAFENYF